MYTQHTSKADNTVVTKSALCTLAQLTFSSVKMLATSNFVVSSVHNTVSCIATTMFRQYHIFMLGTTKIKSITKITLLLVTLFNKV